MKELDLTKILKVGDRVYSPMFGDVVVESIDPTLQYAICVKSGNSITYIFTRYGHYHLNVGECLLFPSKDNRDWSKFAVSSRIMKDYKEKYERAIENLRRIKAANKDNEALVAFIEYEYPELKESENEKIQKPAKNIIETWRDMRLEVYQQATGNRHEPNYADDSTKLFSLNDIDEIIEKISEKQC